MHVWMCVFGYVYVHVFVCDQDASVSQCCDQCLVSLRSAWVVGEGEGISDGSERGRGSGVECSSGALLALPMKHLLNNTLTGILFLHTNST